jgi:hypothetical protein
LLPDEWSELCGVLKALMAQAVLVARVFVVIDAVDLLRTDDGASA